MGTVSGVLLVQIERYGELPNSMVNWKSGPLRLTLPVRGDFIGRYTHNDTRAQARSQALAVGPSVALYGDLNSHALPGSQEASFRFYRELPEALLLNGLNIFALELVSSPLCRTKRGNPQGILAIHFWRPSADEVEESLSQYMEGLAQILHSLSVVHFQDVSHNKAEVNSFFVNVAGLLPKGWSWKKRRQVISRLVRFECPASDDDPVVDGYLYMLAAGQDPKRGVPESSRVEKVKIIPRHDNAWHFLALRDGLAFHQRSTGLEMSKAADFENDALRIYIHSLYLDMFLLSKLQHMTINSLKTRNATASLDDADSLNQLERDVFEFRRNLWFDYATTSKAKPLDIVLSALQGQYSMASDVDQFRDNVAESSRLAMNIREREAAEGQVRTERLIQYVSAIVGPAGLTYTGAAVFTDPSAAAFVMATGFAAVFVALSCAGVAIWTGRLEKTRANK